MLVNDYLKFYFVLICFFISLSYGNKNIGLRDASFLRVGLFFTVCADFCMLILYKNMAGLVFFCFVQLFYMKRFLRFLPPSFLPLFLIVGFAAACCVLFFTHDFLYATAAFYAVAWIFNLIATVEAVTQKAFPRLNNILIAGGMLLFALCDINVALYSLDFFPQYQVTFYRLIWFFYLPSQLLLSVSSVTARRTLTF